MLYKRKSFVLVVSAPSGAGKTTVLNRLLLEESDLRYSVSTTTRLPREGELEGRDYYYVDEDSFMHMVANGAFVEYANVHGHYYGTTVKELTRILESGYDVLLDIDIQGVRQLKKRKFDLVAIFMLPPSLKELQRRLVSRGTESPEALRTRLDAAANEIACAKEYDYLLINDAAGRAVERLRRIIAAERMRCSRVEQGFFDMMAKDYSQG